MMDPRTIIERTIIEQTIIERTIIEQMIIERMIIDGTIIKSLNLGYLSLLVKLWITSSIEFYLIFNWLEKGY